MTHHIAAALFDHRTDAERAIRELREGGVRDNDISVVTMHEGEGDPRAGSVRKADDHDTKASGTAKGLGIGAGVGAIAGLGGLLIPGIGPFIAAGAIAEAIGVAGSAVAVSGAVGAAAGGLTGALVDYGLSQEEAEYFERRVREGQTLVTVDTSGPSSEYNAVRAVLRAAGGQFAGSREEAPSAA